MVKVSYFPNWRVSGGEGVYRIAPSLMVVIPDEANVELQFTNTWVENLGIALTVLTVGGLVAYAVVRRRKTKANS
jgi:uncharacterized membrane protein